MTRSIGSGLWAGGLIVAVLLAPPAALSRLARDAGLISDGIATLLTIGASVIGLVGAALYLFLPLPPLEPGREPDAEFPEWFG